ncbi:MAG: hypothetical protein ABTD50_19380 [Polyangiaceae bacterium]|jgi:hypothetical protein
MSKKNRQNAAILLAETKRRVAAETELSYAKSLIAGIDASPPPAPVAPVTPVAAAAAPAPVGPHPGHAIVERANKLASINPLLAASELIAHSADVASYYRGTP